MRTLLPLLVVALLAVGGCRPAPQESRESQGDARAESGAGTEAQRSDAEALARATALEQERVAAQEREASLEREREARAERDRRAAQDRERVAADRALAEREARVRAEESAIAAERERLALERQRQELEAREAELAERERRLEGQEEVERQAERTDAPPLTDPDSAPAASAQREPVHEQAVLVDRDTPSTGSRHAEASLRAGSVLEVEIQELLTSKTARVGDTFSTRVARDIRNEDGEVVIPIDSTIIGRVTEVKPLRKVGGQAALGLEFTELALPDSSRVSIRASFLELGKNKKDDKKKIAIAAAAGAVLGAVLGHDAGGAAAGAAVGAAAGTAVVATRKDADVEIAPGEVIAMRLEEVVTVKSGMVGRAP